MRTTSFSMRMASRSREGSTGWRCLAGGQWQLSPCFERSEPAALCRKRLIERRLDHKLWRCVQKLSATTFNVCAYPALRLACREGFETMGSVRLRDRRTRPADSGSFEAFGKAGSSGCSGPREEWRSYLSRVFLHGTDSSDYRGPPWSPSVPPLSTTVPSRASTLASQ